MTPEQLLLSALTAVTSALLYVVKELWSKAKECESDRKELRQLVEDVKTVNGELRGYLQAVGACSTTGCTFARPARHTGKVPWVAQAAEA